MLKLMTIAGIFIMTAILSENGLAQGGFETDTFTTSRGDLVMTFVGHGTLMLRLGNYVIHVDPVSREADYTKMPKADLILVTHEHGDHLDAEAVAAVSNDGTKIMYTVQCEEHMPGGIVLANGDSVEVDGIPVVAVPAYNIVHKRENGGPYHPKGVGNGYILTFGDMRVYIAGDTENIPEMGGLGPVDVAFLPMNLPYTMSPEMAADAAKMIGPRILYPYHFGSTDTSEIIRLLDGSGIDVRIRDME